MEELKKKIINYQFDKVKLGHLFKEIIVEIKDDKVYLDLKYEKKDFDQLLLKKELLKYLKVELKYQGAKINFIDLVKEDLDKSSILNKDNILYLIVASGKGGVGKSNVAANMALAFKELNYKVALVDADIYGSSIPHIFNIDAYPPIVDGVLFPYNYDGIDIVSVDFLTRSTLPVIWRGPMLNQALNHFFYFTKYQDDIEIVIIDMPPGTGDVALDIFQMMPKAKQIIVTTPHHDAANIAIKAGLMAQKMNLDVLGIIENMSYYQYENKKLNIFGVGGGDMVANVLNISLLGKLEIEVGLNGSLYEKGQHNYDKYLDIAQNIIDKTSEK
ncbi:MAG: Mrp/NBP35 family ATP-binding protein [Bacilli bacterium]|jgi:ATP-binding protein involved in chromosome partitioning|nr:Mrp/NBP35 family ATP-binding protein [Bacilli bacterium]